MRQRARHITKADETPEFIAFWAIWQPYMNINDGRGSARNEFFRQVEIEGADPQDIVDGAAYFIRSGGQQQIGSDGRAVRLHAQTWLHKAAYEDACEKERAYQQRQSEVTEAKVVQFQPGNTAFLRGWNKKEA